jgi:signal transduction histidine kinase
VAPLLLRSLCWIVELIAVIKGASLFVGIAFAFDSSTPEKSVLVLCGERGDLPAIQAVDGNLREVFHSSHSPRIELFSEYLDFARFFGDQQEKVLLRYLQERYAGRRIDLVMPVTGAALPFALTHRDQSLTETIDEVGRVPKTSAVLFISMLRDGAGQSTSSVDVVRVVLPDGTIRWIGARGRSLNSGNGKATRVLGVSIDVTAQKYAEDRFRLVVEGSPNGIGEVVQFVRSDALERHCMVLSELDPDLPAVSANPVQIHQVLLNIVINAFDAMRQTPVAERRVIIRSERQPNDEVCVSVRDYGTGLPKENPERIFEAFFSTKQDGLGMGLSIARSIISSHGGELTASNAEGGGTCIHFSLPAAEEDVE